MKSKKWLCSLLATAFALSLAGADIASAYCGGGVCGRGTGSCTVEAGKGTCPNYQKGQGRKKGQGRQQCLRGSNCPIAPDRSTPATQPTPPPSN